MLSTREGIRKALVLASRTKPSQVVPRREVRMGSGSTQQEAGKQAGEKDGRLPDQNFHRAGDEESFLFLPKPNKETSQGWSYWQLTDRETWKAYDETI